MLNTSCVGFPLLVRGADYCIDYHMALLKVPFLLLLIIIIIVIFIPSLLLLLLIIIDNNRQDLDTQSLTRGFQMKAHLGSTGIIYGFLKNASSF